MSNPVQSVQVTNTQSQKEESIQPPKTLKVQNAAQNKGAQDTVTVSQEARQALASNTKQASGGDTNPGGFNH